MGEYIRKTIIFTIAILIFASVTVAPAVAFWPFDRGSDKGVENKLNMIDRKIWDLENDDKLMTFINRNLIEQNIFAFKVDITEKGEVKKTYYFIRQTSGPTTISDDYDGEGSIWIVEPNIKQTLDGLQILNSNKLSVRNVLRAIWLSIIVESSGGPSINYMIKNSTWICEYIPAWSWWATACEV